MRRRSGSGDGLPGRRRRDAGVASTGCRGVDGLATRRPARAEEATWLASGHHEETLPASRVVDSFRVEKEGKRAATLGWVGCQSAQKFGPGEIGTGRLA